MQNFMLNTPLVCRVLLASLLASPAAAAGLPEPCRTTGPNRYLISKSIKLSTNVMVKNDPAHCSLLDAFQIANDGKNLGQNKCGAVDMTLKPGLLDVDAGNLTFQPTSEIFLAKNVLRLKNFTLDGSAQTRFFRVTTPEARLVLLDGKLQNGRGQDGGAILVESGADLDVAGVRFTTNVAENSGGAIAFYGYGKLTVRNSLFRSNAAKVYGGALLINGSGNAYIENTRIEANFSDMGGAGVRIDNSDLEVVNSYVNENKASAGNGGGIFSAGRLTMACTWVAENDAEGGDGGGIYIEPASGYVSVRASSIERNRAGVFSDGRGGGVFAGDQFTASNGSISFNRAGYRGGGVFLDDATAQNTVHLENLTVARNEAISGGGVWITGYPTQFTLDDNDPFGALHVFRMFNNTFDDNRSEDSQLHFQDAGYDSFGEILFLNNVITGRKAVPSCSGLVERLRVRRVNDPEPNSSYNVQWPDTTCGAGISQAYGSKGTAYGWLFDQTYSETILGTEGDAEACAAIEDLGQFFESAPCKLGAARSGLPPSVTDPYAPH